jgi:hypothetical protein
MHIQNWSCCLEGSRMLNSHGCNDDRDRHLADYMLLLLFERGMMQQRHSPICTTVIELTDM